MRYFLEMSYKGTAYHGWQRQINALSVQQVVEDALGRLLREEISLTGAGRTDTGVHASYYVAHFDSPTLHRDGNPDSFLYHLNAMLPFDISVSSVTAVADGAHARFDAVLREYRYHILLKKDPFRRETAWYYRGKLDIDKMNEAASLLLRYEDFTTFCKLHSDNKTNICHVSHARWETVGNRNDMVFTIRSDRFLRNMVRSLTGTLTDVGKGKMSVGEFEEALSARDLSRAGNTAPSEGLFLSDIVYPEGIFKKRN